MLIMIMLIITNNIIRIYAWPPEQPARCGGPPVPREDPLRRAGGARMDPSKTP